MIEFKHYKNNEGGGGRKCINEMHGMRHARAPAAKIKLVTNTTGTFRFTSLINSIN